MGMKHAIRAAFALAVCLVLTVSHGAMAAPERAGSVVAVRGSVSVTREDGSQGILTLKSDVFQNDVVRTGARGRIQIAFKDETVLNLGRNTDIQISECVFDQSTGQGALRLDIREGAFRIVGGAIMRVSPENFKAETPTATIGIRGSSFVSQVTAQMTSVVLLGTTGPGIDVSNEDGYRIVYIPGSGLLVPFDQPPGPVQQMDALAKLLLELTSIGGEDTTPGLEVGPQRGTERQDWGGGTRREGAAVDPHDVVPGYRTDSEARVALRNALDQGQNFPMPLGNAVGLDMTYGWALRSLQPDDIWLSLSLQGTRLTNVVDGSMILHTEGTGDASDTFPDGPVSAPPIAFTFADGEIAGNAAIVVTESQIQTPVASPGISNWGWWNMAITDPNAASEPHQVVGLWQGTALVRTAAEWVGETLLGRDFTGTYDGSAHCLQNGVVRLDGTSELSLNFRDYAFTGELDFAADGGPTMGLAGSVNREGIHGAVTDMSGEASVPSSSLRGFFYGAEAHSLQGAFDAQSPNHRYIGVFDATGSVAPTGVRRKH